MAAQTSGTWTNLSGGAWGTGTNWSGSLIAGGTDAVADFSTLDITATRTVTLDGTRTIGTLKAGDATTASHDWIFSTGTLALAKSSGAPTFDVVSRTATLSAAISGTQGFTKTGAGTLVLNNDNGSLLSGGVTVERSTLRLGHLGAAGSGTITVKGNATSGFNGFLDINASGSKNVTLDGVSTTNGYNPGLTVMSGISWSGTVTIDNYKNTTRYITITAGGSSTAITPTIVWGVGNTVKNLIFSGPMALGGQGNLGTDPLQFTLAATNDVLTVNSNQWTFGSVNISAGSTGTVLRTGIADFFGGKPVAMYGTASTRSVSLDLAGYGQNIGGLTLSALDGSRQPNGNSVVTNLTSGTQATLTLSGTGSYAFSNTYSGTFYAGRIEGNLAVRKIGTGTQTLSGVNSYTGNTTINGGVLKLGSAATIGSSPVITVGDTGSVGAILDLTAKSGTFSFGVTQTVKGIGTINIGAGKTVALAGTLAPGNSPGQLNVTGDAAWVAAGLYEWEIASATGAAGSQWDLLGVSGVLDLRGLDASNKFLIDVITLDPTNAPGAMSNYVAGTTYTWRLANASSILLSSGTAAGGTLLTSLFSVSFDSWQNGPAPSSYEIRVADGGAGIELVVVPEPAGIIISAIGVLIIGWRARNHRRAKLLRAMES